MRIEKFEDLIAWQKARILTKKIYEITKHGDSAKDYGLRDQIRRASVSIMSNIAEGFERFNQKEFHYFLNVGKALAVKFVHNFIFLTMSATSKMKNSMS